MDNLGMNPPIAIAMPSAGAKPKLREALLHVGLAESGGGERVQPRVVPDRVAQDHADVLVGSANGV